MDDEKPIWAVQANLLDPVRLEQVANALKNQDIHYVGVQVTPFSDELEYLFDPPTHSCVIPYGSCKLTRISRVLGWTGLFYDEETFRVDAWLRNRPDMLNSTSKIMTVKEAMLWAQLLVTRVEPFHIRPVKDLKAFQGVVTTLEEISRWTKSVDSGSFDFSLDELVAIAPATNILMEWRWFIVGRRIVNGASYKCRGQKLVRREEDQSVIAEAQALADGWLPHETCVMDTALTEDGLKIVEFNTFNSSGFYYHDISLIIREVTNYVAKTS